jgi:PTH1 family peptidyl-tRNA hydrolase
MNDLLLKRLIFIGLGNPGREYRGNRHNIGFSVVNLLAQELGIKMLRFHSKSVVGTGSYQNRPVILAKPQTFMNLSGQAVGGLVKFYKAPLENILIVHDDLDLPLGTLRLRPGGGAGGHNGLTSIIQQLKTQEFPRLRIGIGRPPGQMDAADYVLQDFLKDEQEYLSEILQTGVKACLSFAIEGLTQAMNLFNGSAIQE